MGEVTRNTIPFLLGLRFAFHYILHDHKTHLKAFGIGFTVVVTIVFIIAVLYNAVQQAPFIFLKLSEDNAGESDVYITARMTSKSGSPFVNVTHLNYIANATDMTEVSPRWILPGGGIANPSTPLDTTTCTYLIIDTEREESIGIARGSTVRPLGPKEIHAKGYLLRTIGVTPNRGQRATLSLNIGSLLHALNEESSDADAQRGQDFYTELSNYEALQQLLPLIGYDLDQTIRFNVTDTALEVYKKINANYTVLEQASAVGLEPPRVEVEFTVMEALNVVTMQGELINYLSSDFTVVDSMESAEGFYPPTLGNVVILDSKYIMEMVHEYLVKNLKTDVLDVNGIIKETLDSVDLDQYAIAGVSVIGDRFNFYKSDSKIRSRRMTHITDDLFSDIGMEYPVSLTLPILSAMGALDYVSIFIEQIFFAVVTILSLLGCLVIFSLLFSQTEEKTYEYGMLRALGLNSVQLVEIILGSALFFAIPAILVALILAFLINLIAQEAIDQFVLLDEIDAHLQTWALLIPILLGLFIPLISNFFPIRYALSRTLRDSLDVTHQASRETNVTMTKLKDIGLEPWQTVIAVLLVFFGFMVYYIVPYAFTSDDMGLFFTVLNIILLGMLIGLCITAVVLEPFLEKLLLWLFLWGSERRLLGLILKNMSGHRERSRKTFLMFTVCIAFIIFVSVVFSLMINTIVQEVELANGADIVVQSDTPYYSLPEDELSLFLSGSRSASRIVKDYVYVTFSMDESNNYVTMTDVSNLSFFPVPDTNVYGVGRNYLSATHAKYLEIDELAEGFSYIETKGKTDIFDSLYRDKSSDRTEYTPDPVVVSPFLFYSESRYEGEQNRISQGYEQELDIIISEAVLKHLSIDMDQRMILRFRSVNSNGGSSDIYYMGRPRAAVSKVPGFQFSGYENTADEAPLLISMDAYEQVLRQSAEIAGQEYSRESVNKQRLLINLVDGATRDQREEILNLLSGIINSDFATISDTTDLMSNTESTRNAINYIFIAVALIASLLCFFHLMVSFSSNVSDNSWEFGVLRSIGLSAGKLIRVYIYEAVALVLAAFICGTIIGCVIAATLSAQYNLYVEMAFQFDFPWLIFFVLLALALFVAVIGSYIPAHHLRKQQIALVLRGLE